MSEQTGPDGSKPVPPPRFGETTTGSVPDAGPQPLPPPQPPPSSEQTAPPTGLRPQQPARPDPPPPGQPPKSGGPPSGGGSGGTPPSSSGGGGRKKGIVITLLVALGVGVAATIGFVVTRPADSEPPTSAATTDEFGSEMTTTVAATTLPESTAAEPTGPDSTTTIAAGSGSLDGVFVRIDARAEIGSDADLDATLRQIGLADGDNPVSTTEPVVNLCAASAVDAPVSARVEWRRDNLTILANPARQFAVPADGGCIDNDGAPLEDGVYEVFFTDADGGESQVALFTVGSATRSQVFLNDTGVDICFVDLAPSTAGFFRSYVPPDDRIADGETITIDIADLEHEVGAVDCDENVLETVFFTPSDDEVSLSSGRSGPPTTLPPTTLPPTTLPSTTLPPSQITDEELTAVAGIIGSFDVAVDPGSAAESALIDELIAPGPPLPIASEDRSVTLCSAWFTGGPFEGDAVWEFNGEFFNREPAAVADGVATSCIPPNGVAAFGEGAYQVYLERDGTSSTVQTFTVGRAETGLGFVNDTGVEVCAVGFSPTLSSFYTFSFFAQSEEFVTALQPGESFTIRAPFIENDIQARDCDGNVVAETLDIPPTDQTLSLSTGQP